MSERAQIDLKKTAATTVGLFFSPLLTWAIARSDNALFVDSMTVFGLLLLIILITYVMEIRRFKRSPIQTSKPPSSYQEAKTNLPPT